MDYISWKPLDLVVGGMLTAGVAFGVYRLGVGVNNRKLIGGSDKYGSSGPQSECIAFGSQSSSELEISVRSQVISCITIMLCR
jgi:hypothetical protein